MGNELKYATESFRLLEVSKKLFRDLYYFINGNAYFANEVILYINEVNNLQQDVIENCGNEQKNMNAHEARKQAEKANKERTDKSLLKIQRSILRAAKYGEFKCYHYDFISEFAKAQLIKDGYKIDYEEGDRVGEYRFKVSW